eukprot:364676-Chlamydomonas_euryale.AAC.6
MQSCFAPEKSAPTAIARKSDTPVKLAPENVNGGRKGGSVNGGRKGGSVNGGRKKGSVNGGRKGGRHVLTGAPMVKSTAW